MTILAPSLALGICWGKVISRHDSIERRKFLGALTNDWIVVRDATNRESCIGIVAATVLRTSFPKWITGAALANTPHILALGHDAKHTPTARHPHISVIQKPYQLEHLRSAISRTINNAAVH